MKNSFLTFLVLMLSFGLSQAQKPVTNRFGQYLRLQPDSTYVLRDYAKVDSVSAGNKRVLAAVPYNYDNGVDRRIDKSSITFDTVVYKTRNGRDLMMYIERPTAALKLMPFMVFVHGGGWQGGSPDRYREESSLLALRGVCGVRITYSVIPNGATFDTAMEDINDALSYLKENAARFNIDPVRFGFCGDSAGAHLGGVMAMTTPDCKVFVGISGAYDLTCTNQGNFPNDNLKQKYFGTTSNDVMRTGSPLHLIPQNPPAVLLFHGTADLVIDYAQSKKMAAALKSHGGKVFLNIHKGYAHTYSVKSYSDRYDEIVDGICRFVLKYL